jgi:DNA-binding SARP family transcriptional activator/tetratricopeptide (TPR) repeat protein
LLRVQLLGPVRAWVGEQELELGGPRRRAVLGMLAIRANQAVSRSELIDGMWGEDPPASAVNSVHVYVAGLRRVLEPRRARRAPGQVLSAAGPGYLLRLEPGQLDTQALDRHLAQARQRSAAADPAVSAQSLDAALGLWQGSALSGVPGPWADVERARLNELRLTAIEERVELSLALGDHHQVVAQLAGLIREYPLRERFRGQLMVALYRCGRQAEALAEFAEARRVLAEELGIEPGPGLRRLQRQVLNADPALDVPAGTSAVPGTSAMPGTGSLTSGGGRGPARPQPADLVPRELPADVNAFTGRAGELAELDRLLAAGAHDAGHGGPETAAAVVISAVAGSAGVGKTTLAVHWAHRVRDAFPDGHLYVNLRGYDPGEPVAATDALAGFLCSLGVAAQDIPAGVEERAARYRSMLDGRRLLVVLDNAAGVEQISPLLPGTPSCVVVVTSRDSLAGLVARYGARRLDLDLLPAADAVTLLRVLIGARVDADPDAAATLAGQCARLPLALRVAAEFAVTRPGLTLAQLVSELGGEQRRLDLLEAGGDPRTAVRTVFSWSYRHLSADVARAFRLVGLHPGPDLDVYAAAALTGATPERAHDVLDLLARAHLIHSARAGRYGMHDLLRAYARDLAATEDADTEEGRRALTRLLDYYLAAAAAAMDTAVPAERNRRPRIPPPATPIPPMGSPAAAQAWLDGERATLVAAAYTAVRGWPDHAARLSAILWRYIETGGHYTDAVTVHTGAVRAARQAGDRAAEAYALNALGIVERRGRTRQAVGYLQQALALFSGIGDRFGAACALTNLGSCDWRQGRYAEAASHRRQALALYREVGDRLGEARALKGLGLVECRQGRYRLAAGHFQESLVLYGELGDRSNEARALVHLGIVDGRVGRYPQAVGHLRQALGLFREIGDRSGAASALAGLGSVAGQQGHYLEAVGYFQRALTLFREIGERDAEAEALNSLGEVMLAAGQPGQAHAQHGAALDLANRGGDKYEQARAHNGLAGSFQAVGDPGQACYHWRHALARYTSLGLPEAAGISASLNALEAGPAATSMPTG